VQGRTYKYYKDSLMVFVIRSVRKNVSMNVVPCHHGIARPQVADGGTASYMEGSCE
jgi:hypothetical protein